MANDYFDADDYDDLVRLTLARAALVNAIFAAIIVGFDRLPSEARLKQNRVTYAVDTGTANVYAVALPHSPVAYTAGLAVVWQATNPNTGASTLNCNTIGAVALKRYDGSALESGDIPDNAICFSVHDGTNFQQLWPIAGILTAATAQAVAAAASAITAGTHATTATTQAGIATAQAIIATAQAVIATAQAAAAAASAGSAKRLFLGALTGSGDAMVSAVSFATVSDGMLLEFTVPGTSTIATPVMTDGAAISLNVSDKDGAALPAGGLFSGRFYQGTYFATGTEVRLHSHSASQAVAVAGTDNVADMTALRTKQLLDANLPADVFVRSATTPYTGLTGDKVAMDCSSAAKTYNLPTSVTADVTRSRVSKIGRNLLTISPGSNKIQLPNGNIVTGSVVVVGAFNGILDFRFVGTIADGTTLVWAL